MKPTTSSLAIVILATALGGCSGEPELLAHDIWFAGCKTVLAGPVCVVADDQPLFVWVPTDAPATFRSSRSLEVTEAIDIDNGVRYEVVPTAGASELSLFLSDDNGKRHWRLALSTARDPAWLVEAASNLRSGNYDRARELIAPLMDADGLARRGAAFGVLGRVQLRMGEINAATASLRRGMELNLAEGRLFDGLSDGLALAFTLIHSDKQFAVANEVLAGFADGNGHAEWNHWLAYHRGDAAAEAGDARGALRAFTEAAHIAKRFGWQRFELNAEQLIAVQLQQLGLREDARAILGRWSKNPPADAPDCERGLFHTNVGWNELLALEAREEADDPLPALQRALELVSADCRPADIANAHVNLALAYIHAGRPGLAEQHLGLARVTTAEPPLRLALWAIDIEARIAAMRGDADAALAAYEQLERLAAATLSPTARWRAAVGKATLARNNGDLRTAAAAFARADSLLMEDLARVPITTGRETLAATRQWVTRLHLETLLETGDTIGAYTLARRARQRLLTGLRLGGNASEYLAGYSRLRAQLDSQMRSQWAVPRDELVRIEAMAKQLRRQLDELIDDAVTTSTGIDESLSRPDRGTLFLVLHPLGKGWAVFSDDGERIDWSHQACDNEGAPALADCMLRGVGAQIAQATTVLFFPAGGSNSVDFHAASVDGRPLLERVNIAYAADLPPAPGTPDRTALLVADPQGNLPGARAEASDIATMLAQRGWQATTLAGRAAASSAVRDQLARVGLFHFAGHAQFGTRRGWDSELRLAEQTVLTITDILALATPPSLVVLSGCETATVATGRLPDSIGIANAFVAAGSQLALAAARPVPDSVAIALMSKFYRHWLDGAPATEALRQAQLSQRAVEPDTDWSTFRIVLRSTAAASR